MGKKGYQVLSAERSFATINNIIARTVALPPSPEAGQAESSNASAHMCQAVFSYLIGW